MPNYRQKNRNRNKNKNRHKNQQQQQQQQQEQPQEPSKKTETSVNVTQETTNATPINAESQSHVNKENVATSSSNVCDRETKTPNVDFPALDEANVITCGTVPCEPAKKRNENATTTKQTETCRVVANEQQQQTMGNAKTKNVQTPELEEKDKDEIKIVETLEQTPSVPSTPRQQAKVIVHRVVCENVTDIKQNSKTQVQEKEKEKEKTIERKELEIANANKNSEENKEFVKSNENKNSKENVISVQTNENATDLLKDSNQNRQVKRDFVETPNELESVKSEIKVIIHQIQLEDGEGFTVNPIHSPVHIEEIGEDSLIDLDEIRSPVVSEVESSAEYDYDEDDIESDDVAELTTSTTSSQREKRKQKRLALENHFLPQMLNPRFLDSISEENSDLSECGDNPLSRSASAESAIAVHPNELKAQKLNAKYPKSSLDFSKTHKHTLTPNTIPNSPDAIREEPVALAVEARFHEAPDADESCTTLKGYLSPHAEVAEMVFINSASSNEMDNNDRISLHSASSLAFDLDTDAKDLINKPGTDKILTSSTSAATAAAAATASTANAAASDATANLPINGKENDSKNVNNAQIPSSPAIDQLVFSNAKEDEQQTQSESPSTLFSYGSGQQRFASDVNNDAHCLLTDTQSRLLETSCVAIKTKSVSSLRADKNAKQPPQVLTEKNVQNMNTVRDILNTDNAQTLTASKKINGNSTIAQHSGDLTTTTTTTTTHHLSQILRSSPSPPPIPPPPTGTVTLDYTESSSSAPSLLPLLVQNLKQHNGQNSNEAQIQPPQPLPRTTAPNSHASNLTALTRQASLDSHCSDSTTHSQCTAINVGSNQNKAFDQTSSISDLKLKTTTTTTTAKQQPEANSNLDSPTDPKKLRLLCTETLAALPYGDEVLEELATIAKNIGEVKAANVVQTHTSEIETTKSTEMPYPLPELPHIDDLQLCMQSKSNNSAPQRPPSPNRPESWLGMPTVTDPKLLVCLSPSQRSYIEQQQTVVTSNATKEPTKPDDLLDAHQRFVERRGYHEYSNEQLANLEKEKLAEQQLLQTAALMKKLRKSLTPPPPQIPPPPVPAKSNETAAIAQNLSKRTIASTSSTSTNTVTKNTSKTQRDVMPMANEAGDKTDHSDGEENQHRLLSIIHDDTSDFRQDKRQQQPQSQQTTATSSSFENNSRQTTTATTSIRQPPATPQQISSNTFIIPIALTTNGSSNKSYNFPSFTGSMQGVESSLSEMFPSLGSSDIFDNGHKRFSNIESSTMQPILDTKPKRYSCIESHSYESAKRLENGKLVDDFSNSKHEKQKYGDPPEISNHPAYNKFPLKSPLSSSSTTTTEAPLFSSAPMMPPESTQNILTAKPDDHEIMSALKLNNKHSSEKLSNSRQTTTHSMSSHIAKTENSSESKRRDEVDFVATTKQNNEQHMQNASERMTALKRGISDTYEEFRQRAKEAADTTIPTPHNNNMMPSAAKVTSNGESTANGSSVISSSSSATTTKKTVFQHDHEKLFKEFDDLSKQLNKELEMNKKQREQKEKSSSLYDLNRIQLRQKEQIEEYNKQRHSHMRELEQEIERSMKSRQLRMGSLERTCSADYSTSNGRTHEIPIHMENGNGRPSPYMNGSANSNVTPTPRSYQIPIHLENGSTPDDGRNRRAESMFNLSSEENTYRQRTYSNQRREDDDWAKYANDLGSSENITRPFAKEVEICYQRRPGGIRAPRMTASTNDLSYSSQSFDQHNAYNVRRSHAPMLNRAPQQNRPHFGSCYSMIERDPNPKYISTTSRRGVSPAPQPTGFHPLEAHVSEDDMRQRRASLPRELHEQQLKYITSKEDELRMEFERLQNERRRLMEEMSQATTMPMPQPSPRAMRDPYRSIPKLPTLSEDEVFRQQMAEEWLKKVAERENRRLQNIIKISKLHEEEVAAAQNSMQKNLGDEFLNRVKERRTKLAMPADSDWESGAESHPNNQGQFSESEDMPPVKIIEGENEANFRNLPRHLREFAKFSNHQRDEIEGGHREQHQEEERSQEATDNSYSKAFKKSTTVKTVKTLRAPMMQTDANVGGQGESINANKKSNVLNASANSCNQTNANNTKTSNRNNNNKCRNNIDDIDTTTTTTTQENSLNSVGVGSVLGTAVLIGLSAWTAWRRFT